MPIIHIARYTLSFTWIYHGFFPKIFSIAPIERAMTASLGLDPHLSNIITTCAGVLEILCGLIVFVFFRNKLVIYANIFALVALLVFVSIMLPTVLIEAFNPVTTNLMMIVLSVIILLENQPTKKT